MILGMQESIRNCMDLKNNRAKQIAENRAVIQENMEKSVPLEEIIRQKQKIIDAKQDEINRHNSRHESLELPEVLLICASSLYNCDNKRCYEEAVGVRRSGNPPVSQRRAPAGGGILDFRDDFVEISTEPDSLPFLGPGAGFV